MLLQCFAVKRAGEYAQSLDPRVVCCQEINHGVTSGHHPAHIDHTGCFHHSMNHVRRRPPGRQFVGLLLYRFDVNVRSSLVLVLGLVGAGGIGLLINQPIKSFQFDAMATQILVVLVLIVLVDQLSSFIRRRLEI